ncbi:Uncharacterized conserved protein YjiS, DUF1127 family [Roseovarius azorensis]|uniref:Uncharacterized conserved protein YjiS, DUF1127 family n=1 Tax=Roseovarius azorensis TaxID=1287727 RepID=A0A1H7M9B6_9RHOB|nr:DUF1127 domain-containing protein [Roseovarius azorensis]SEL07754.1 Uncharacterized conserved protein YjiS, DUF1127 family [Roseovarius azorensis]
MTVHSRTNTLLRPVIRPVASLREMLAVRRQRLTLRELDDRALADIGLTRQAALTEARRPFWDLPACISR